MFIFNRPFQAVAAGLGVALLVVCLDSSCATSADAAPRHIYVTEGKSPACAAPVACGIVRAGS
jgi:hypothetical protein